MTRGSLVEPLTVGALSGAALVVVDPAPTGIPWCPSALLWDTACPLCGLTRGVARLVRGDLAASWAFHPMAWWVLLVMAVAWLAWLGRRAGWWGWRNRRIETALIGITLGGFALTWLLRAATGTLPPIG